MSNAELIEIVRTQAATIDALSRQLQALQQQSEWFRRQLFGSKRERYAPEPDPRQMVLGEAFATPATQNAPPRTVATHTRRVSARCCTVLR